MARPTSSNIDTVTINEQYPVAGVDNDSQGFRDNFDTIKTNFTSTKSEVEDLMENTARLDVENDFDNNNVTRANFVECTEDVHNNSSFAPAGTFYLSFKTASYHNVNVGDDVTIVLTRSDWPATGKLGKMRVVVKATDEGGPYTITWGTQGGTMKNDGAAIWSSFQVSSTTNPVVVDFWTDDAGTIVYGNYVGSFS